MKMYKGTACGVTLVGCLEGIPIIHETTIGEDIITFLITRIRPGKISGILKTHDQIEWYRIFVKRNNAINIEKNAYSGMRLMVEGDIMNCYLEKTNDRKFIITEIFAKRISYFSPEKINQYATHEDDAFAESTLQKNFQYKISSSIRVAYLH
ncbi:MAG TPA: single-stranded DNA-binding protein [Coxiellaceae bacterium]|nr:MAG: hypothetical protein A3E81_02970 [Gammaproteobacteria bacterium RIFCSPHIGHO2_12_FULL_36_30]HLB56277.1 single-stranded DNA-binding protein [Coxiellaceae bacterium]